jgi:hypothetical protein
MEWKVILVYFWSAEVDPSLEDILEINRLYNYHHHEGLEVIGITWTTVKNQ